ncbi:hypothetical protein HWV62_30621 [Athelia sp. TMB]|nr:hypothetical protein HWV62_30621 [Athelia sp. TMB]
MSHRGHPSQGASRGNYQQRPPHRGGGHGGGGPTNLVDAGPLTTLANLFEVTNLPSVTYFQYQVGAFGCVACLTFLVLNHTADFVKPQTKNRNRCAEIIDRLQNHTAPSIFASPAIFDGRSALYAAGRPLRIPDNTQAFSVKMSDASSKEHVVRLTLVGNRGINASHLQQLISAEASSLRDGLEKESQASVPMSIINLLVRAAPSLTAIGQGMDVHQVRSARLYVTDIGKRELKGGLEMWQGYFQITPGPLPDVVMSVVSAAHLRAANVRDIIKMRKGDNTFRTIESFLKKIFVLVDMNSSPHRPPARGSRKKQIIGIMSKTQLDNWTFLKDGQPMTVQAYYMTTYNKSISDAPFAIMTGNRENPTVFPANHCWITPGQVYKKKLSPSQMQEAIPFTTKRPQDRLQTILQGIGAGKNAGLDAPTLQYQNSPVIRASGMMVSSRPLEIHGQILRTPQVQFGGGMHITPKNGAWNLIEEARGNNVTFILIILPDSAEDIKNRAKYYGDVKCGIPTQCVTVTKVRNKADDQYCNNVVLKINARLGGINFLPNTPEFQELRKSHFMIFGMDVSHPPPGVKNMPSIAGVVSSVDSGATIYEAQSSVQEPSVEIIIDLAKMVFNLMKSYLKMHDKLPLRLIFFRDGVSEGQFSQVCLEEVTQIKKVVDSFKSEYMKRKQAKPEITFVIVRKRHHVRFFPLNNRGQDSKGNVQAGFLADKGIISEYVTIQLPNQSLKGLETSRPSYYTVLHDECFANAPAVLKDLSYALCHCYAAATRSVSIPAPIYYADKVCSRAKFHYAPDADLLSNAGKSLLSCKVPLCA